MRFGIITLAALSVCSSVASADVLLGSFEGSLAGSLPDSNWALRNNVNALNTGAAAANFGYLPTFATEGSTAMRIRVPGGFTWGLELTQGGGGGDTFRNAWNSHDALRFDVTIDGGTPATDPYQVFLASINSDGTGGGWQQAGPGNLLTTVGGENGAGAGTVTFEWKYREQGKLFPADTAGFTQLNIATNGGNYDIAPFGHFDNARLVVIPEPTTLTVLASAGLMALRRRR